MRAAFDKTAGATGAVRARGRVGTETECKTTGLRGNFDLLK